VPRYTRAGKVPNPGGFKLLNPPTENNHCLDLLSPTAPTANHLLRLVNGKQLQFQPLYRYNMDVKTVDFTPFTDQKPGTYVTDNPTPAQPAEAFLRVRLRDAAMMLIRPVPQQLRPAQEGRGIPEAELQRVLCRKHPTVHSRGR
jgi:hypothetical protein